MKVIQLTPIETLIAKPKEKRTAVEQAIVTAYQQGDPLAEKAAVEWLYSPKRWSEVLAQKQAAS